MFRSSRPEVLSKKGVLRNFAKFTEKHLCRSLFFNKVAGLRLATLLKKRLCLRPATYSEHLFYRTPLDDFFCVLNMPRYFTFHISLEVLCDNWDNKVAHLQKLANQSVLNGARVVEKWLNSSFRACLHETQSKLRPVWDFTSA